jgi:hypothetical protein
MGLIISEGKVPDAGVCKWVAGLGLLSSPAAAMVAEERAVAMMGWWDRRRRLREMETEESNE